MTGNFFPQMAVEEAEQDVGFKEGWNNWNPYSLWQYGSPNNPYCNSATCKWSYDAGFRFWPDCTFGEKGESYTPTYALKARNHGVWRDKWWRANPGDDVEFDWGNNGLIDHVEKVVADDGVTIITVGANTSNGVYFRRRDRKYVSNFVALSEAGQTADGQDPSTPVIPKEENVPDIILAPTFMSPDPSRPAAVSLDIPGKRVIHHNSVRFNGVGVKQGETSTAIPADQPIIGWTETRYNDGRKKGFVVLQKKGSDGKNAAFEYTWPLP